MKITPKQKLVLVALGPVVMAVLMTVGGIFFGNLTSHPGIPNHRTVVLDGGLRTISWDRLDDLGLTVTVRDVRACYNSPDPAAVCSMTEYSLDANGKFVRRVSYNFNHGNNIGTGELVQIGKTENHSEKVWGIGNPIPYYFHTYVAGSRTIQLEQQRLKALLAEIPKA